MGLLADFREFLNSKSDFEEFQKPKKAEAIRAQIEELTQKRRAIQVEAINLVHKAEELEGTAKEGPTALPKFMQ